MGSYTWCCGLGFRVVGELYLYILIATYLRLHGGYLYTDLCIRKTKTSKHDHPPSFLKTAHALLIV